MNYCFLSISQRVSKQMRKTRPYQFGVCWLHISIHIDLHLESDVSIFLKRTTKQHFHQRHVLPMQMKLNTVYRPAYCLPTYLPTHIEYLKNPNLPGQSQQSSPSVKLALSQIENQITPEQTCVGTTYDASSLLTLSFGHHRISWEREGMGAVPVCPMCCSI